MSVAEPVTLLAGSVITMTDAGRLTDQAIRIADGRIAELGPREHADLTGRVLDWRERTVVPALADCHVHVMERGDMLQNLAHGVTVVRNMWGNPWHLLWQRDVASGKELGPLMVTTSPLADGLGLDSGTTIWPSTACVRTHDDAHRAVEKWADLGYEQVKAYSWLTDEALHGLGDAAREAGIPLVGHCPQMLSVHEAIDAGQTCFEHLTNYEYGVLPQDARDRLDAMLARGVGRWSLEVAEVRAEMDDTLLQELAQRMADEQIVSCATLVVMDRLYGERNFDDPRMRFVDPIFAEFWRPENHFLLNFLTPEALARTGKLMQERVARIMNALREAGAPVLVGTDTPNPFVFQGSSVVEEMELLVQAGYTPLEVLTMATAGAADFLDLPDRGRVEVGAIADLMAVSGDPGVSVDALRDPAAVVVGGHVLDRARLDGLLAEAEDSLRAEPVIEFGGLEAGEWVVGEYDRHSHGHAAGRTRVCCCAPMEGLTQWREQVISRLGDEERRTLLDADGHLVSARITRRRHGATEHAEVTSTPDLSTYEVTITTADGSTVTSTVDGPLLPGVDFGAPAVLAAAQVAGDEPARVLSLDAAFMTGLVPIPGELHRTDDGLLQRTLDGRRRVSGDAELEHYETAGLMDVFDHRRRPS